MYVAAALESLEERNPTRAATLLRILLSYAPNTTGRGSMEARRRLTVARVPWRGVTGQGQVEEGGWEYRRRQPEGTVLAV